MRVDLYKRGFEILKKIDLTEIEEEGGSIEFIDDTYSIDVQGNDVYKTLDLLDTLLMEEMAVNGFDENQYPTHYGREVEEIMDYIFGETRVDKHPLTGHWRNQMNK